jgi:DNA-directed RNA polymerase specialized sigma24 family protein
MPTHNAHPKSVRYKALRLWNDTDRTAREIAAMLNVPVPTIYRWVGPRSSKGNAYPETYYRQAIRLRREEGKTNAEIAELLDGPTESTIWYWMGATPRANGGSPHHRPPLRGRAMYLRSAGYTVREIAEEMNLPRSTVGDWVRGMPCDL